MLRGARTRNHNNNHARRRYLERRLEILRAAGRQFRDRGFAETGMRDIAEAAALSPANLYNYFEGKHEILYFCQDNSLDRLIAALDHARRLRGSAAHKIRFVIASHLRCVLDEVEGAAAHFLTTSQPRRLRERLLGKRDRYEDGVRQLIAAGIRSGEFAPCDPAMVTRILLGAMNWSASWFNPEGPLTSGEITEKFADYLIRGLLGKPEPVKGANPSSKTKASIGVFKGRGRRQHVSAG